MIKKLFCKHCWINILRLQGEVTTKKGVYIIDEVIFVDYCPKCGKIRGRK